MVEEWHYYYSETTCDEFGRVVIEVVAVMMAFGGVCGCVEATSHELQLPAYYGHESNNTPDQCGQLHCNSKATSE